MINNINNFGTINFYENNSTNSKKEQAECEDIQPIQEEKSKPKGICPCITKAAHDAGKAQDVDSELRSASTSAPKLVKAITTNEALGYVDTKNMTSEDLYNLLNEYYNLPFKARCFRYYRSK